MTSESGSGPVAAHDDQRLAPATVVDPSLVRVADLAVRLLGAGSAQVSMVLDEQTVVGGAAGPAGAVRTAATVCEVLGAAVMRTGAPVLVDDVVTDPRVRALAPGSTGAYLGVPLLSGGHAVGAFSVLDVDPRHWTPQDLAVLETLAAPVLAERELAALESAYESDRLMWEVAVDAAGVGVWDWDLRTQDLRFDDRLLTVFGLTRESFGGTIEAFWASVHPDDRVRVEPVLQNALETCGSYAAEYRVLIPDGSVRWVAARGRALAAPGGGAAVRMLGAAYDTTAVQEGEARLARVMEAMPSGFYQLDHEWRFNHVNSEAKRVLGNDIDGEVLWERFPAAAGTEFETKLRHALETGEPVIVEDFYPEPLDLWFETRAWPTPEGISIYFYEVTERHRAQDAVRLAARRNELLVEVTSALAETLEVEEAALRLAQILVPALGDWCMVSLADPVSITSGGPLRLRDVATWHAEPERRPWVSRYSELRETEVIESEARDGALISSRPIVLADGMAEMIANAVRPGEATDLLRRLDPETAVVVPLRGRGRTTGVVSVTRDRGRPAFTDDEVDTLADLAGRAGLAIDNLRAFSEQRALAEGLQRSLLTPPPALDGLDVAVRYEPAARAAQVGGDWYDAFELPGGTLTLVIGDVVGHDTAAAAAMGQLRSLVRGIAVTAGESPGALLRRVDEAIETLRVETTATAIVAHVERAATASGAAQVALRWSTAGHPPPLLAAPVSGSDQIEVRELSLAQPDLLLGLDPSTARSEDVVELPPGATVLLYTDGLVERRDESIDDGTARLAGILGDLTAEGVGLDELCDRLLAQMLPERPDDDVALIAVRVSGPTTSPR